VKDQLTVGSVASAAGVTPDTVRYYERLRLLSRAPRSRSGYRVFGEPDVERVRAIRRAQSLGMTLTEIAALYPQGRIGRGECQRVRNLVATKIAQTDARIVALRAFERELRAHLRECDRALVRDGDALCPVFAPGVVKPASRRNGRRT
jgi:MerR family copper efflux transcriptional regulator